MIRLFSSFVLFALNTIRFDAIRYLLLKLLFKKNGLCLTFFKSLNNDRFFIYNVNGVFLPDVSINWYKTLQHFKEESLKVAFLNYKPKAGDIVVDIGAGIGEESIVLAHDFVGENGKVYSIEANPGVYQVLKEVVDLNRFKNIKTFNIAINKENAPIALVDEAEDYVSGTIGRDPLPSAKKFMVKGMRFDSFMQQEGIARIDLLKCNIEGAERFLVDTIGEENVKKIKHVAISCHDFRYQLTGINFFKTRDYVVQYLTGNGFEITTVNSGQAWKDDWVYGKNPRFHD